MKPVLADQRSQDASMEQNWVNIVEPDSANNNLTSQGNDLQAAINATSSVSGGSQLAAGASAFSQDASAFLSDESIGLMPGWTSEYDKVKYDIYKLAADCGWK